MITLNIKYNAWFLDEYTESDMLIKECNFNENISQYGHHAMIVFRQI